MPKKYQVLQDLVSFFREELFSVPQVFSEAIRKTNEILSKMQVPGKNLSAYISREKIPVKEIPFVKESLDQIEEQNKRISLIHQQIPDFFPSVSQIVQFSQKLIDNFPHLSSVKPYWGHLTPDNFQIVIFYAINEDSFCELLQNLANLFTKKTENKPGEILDEGVEILVHLAKLSGQLLKYVNPNMLFRNPPSIVQELITCRDQIKKIFGPFAELYQSRFMDEILLAAHQGFEKLKYDGDFKSNESSISLTSGFEIKPKYKGLAKLSQFIKNLFPK